MKKLKKILKSMYNEGGDDNFLTIADDPYYLQIIGGKKSDKIFIDAVSNQHLGEEEYLSEEQLKKLEELGYEKEPRSGNFSKELEFSDAAVDNISDFIVKTLEIYGIDPFKAEFEFEID